MACSVSPVARWLLRTSDGCYAVNIRLPDSRGTYCVHTGANIMLIRTHTAVRTIVGVICGTSGQSYVIELLKGGVEWSSQRGLFNTEVIGLNRGSQLAVYFSAVLHQRQLT